ncbi:hypothetical protein JST99_01210 [Candidatus Dependentiae bacterium]|nr:hypothetical protein [Candidatus Dependentiae bacterium]MCC7414870.1 hypothetical protein [Campylobacterota bacterium]
MLVHAPVPLVMLFIASLCTHTATTAMDEQPLILCIETGQDESPRPTLPSARSSLHSSPSYGSVATVMLSPHHSPERQELDQPPRVSACKKTCFMAAAVGAMTFLAGLTGYSFGVNSCNPG